MCKPVPVTRCFINYTGMLSLSLLLLCGCESIDGILKPAPKPAAEPAPKPVAEPAPKPATNAGQAEPTASGARKSRSTAHLIDGALVYDHDPETSPGDKVFGNVICDFEKDSPGRNSHGGPVCMEYPDGSLVAFHTNTSDHNLDGWSEFGRLPNDRPGYRKDSLQQRARA